MSLLHTILSALAPIVFVTALGWVAGLRGLLRAEASGILAVFVVRFALPLSLFLAAATAKRSEILNPDLLLTLALGLVGSLVVGVVLSRVLLRHSLSEAGIAGLAGSFGNMAYCGPPVLAAVAGAGGTLVVVIGNLILAILMLPSILVLISHGEAGGELGGGIGRSLLDAVEQPLFFLPAAGLVLALLGVPVPALVVTAVDQVGRAAGGVALFTLGLILSGIRFQLNRDVVTNVLVKNFLQPALFLGIGLLVGLRGTDLQEVFLLGVLPSATAVPTLALAHRVYADQAAASVFASTILSVLTISVAIAIAGSL